MPDELSLTNEQQLIRTRADDDHIVEITARRQVTLSEDLAQIESRHLTHLRLRVTRYASPIVTAHLTREAAKTIRDALSEALDLTDAEAVDA